MYLLESCGIGLVRQVRYPRERPNLALRILPIAIVGTPSRLVRVLLSHRILIDHVRVILLLLIYLKERISLPDLLLPQYLPPLPKIQQAVRDKHIGGVLVELRDVVNHGLIGHLFLEAVRMPNLPLWPLIFWLRVLS